MKKFVEFFRSNSYGQAMFGLFIILSIIVLFSYGLIAIVSIITLL